MKVVEKMFAWYRKINNKKYISIFISFALLFIIFINNSSSSVNNQMSEEETQILKPIFEALGRIDRFLNNLRTKSIDDTTPSRGYIISISGWEPLNDESYNLFVKSGGLRNITVILPIVTYKGKPIEGIVKWVEEMIKEVDANIFKEAKDINVGIINTKYGPMMKIYIPILNENYNQFLKTASPDFNSKFIKEKYTKVSPHWLSEEFGITPIVRNGKWKYKEEPKGDVYQKYRERYIDTYIYADWKGSNNLYVDITILIMTFFKPSAVGDMWYIIALEQDSEIIKIIDGENLLGWPFEGVSIKFKKPGWTKIRLIQHESINIPR